MDTLYIYREPSLEGKRRYDMSLAVASLQGLINREGPILYVIPAPRGSKRVYPEYWLDVFSKEGRWLYGRNTSELGSFDELMETFGSVVKGVVIWDPEVSATVNVATTIAGVEDGIVLSPELAETLVFKWNLRVIKDLRGMFDGAETGSAKNDAYRWAIGEYFSKGLCSSHLLCLYEDAFSTREKGNTRYVVTRDWAVKNRAFVFDLSPWGDETPYDDPKQPLGTDFETYKMILEENLKHSAGEHMTELAGFFAFHKYSNVTPNKSIHEPVPTEWETVYLITPYNCYQNTVAHNCYNQSFHSSAPFTKLKQGRPKHVPSLENKVYLCFLMADYDSTTPLYEFMPRLWDDPNRGKIPLAWGINPNLIETYPDIISYLYETATDNDYFVSDATGAGYFNPNRIKPEYLPLMIRHNKHFYEQTGMSIAGMVLDWDEPTPAVKDGYREFAPDGFAIGVIDFHGCGGKAPEPHVWKGMPVIEFINSACHTETAEEAARLLLPSVEGDTGTKPNFHYIRIVWKDPSFIMKVVELLRNARPDLHMELVDPYTFFGLFKQYYEKE